MNSRCDCSKGNFSIFCIQNKCKFQRRLCGQCKNQYHSGHHTIQYDDQNQFNVFSINNGLNRSEIQGILGPTIERIQNMSHKSSTILKQLIKKIQKLMNFELITPLRTLYGTTFKDQQQGKSTRKQKMEQIIKQGITKDQLDKIAEQFFYLKQNKELYKKVEWIQSMSYVLKRQVTRLTEKIDRSLGQINTEIDQFQLQSLCPFSSGIQSEIIRRKQRLNQLVSLNSQSELFPINHRDRERQREEERQNFLRRFDKKVIGRKYSCSVEEWKKGKNKKFIEIEELDFHGLNLQAIPQQISLFPNLKEIDFGQNRISRLDHLGNLAKLQLLQLASNKIDNIENLYTLNNLKKLYLQNNSIKQFENLEHLNNLVVLNLEANPLKKTEDRVKMFKNMKKNGLQKLYLPSGWNI